MKFDGHVKLTLRALKKVKQNCPTNTGVCNAPMFKTTLRIWLGDSEESNATDNYSAAIVNYVTHSLAPDIIFQVKLPDAVAFVDLDERWTHDDPKGQRFHFMKSKGETNDQSYQNAVRFIKTHTENWVNAAKDIIKEKNKPKPLQKATWRESRAYVKELALALHCLQDSFSPGHTQRYYGETITMPYSPGCTDQAAPIRSLFVYKKQDHDKHGDHDYLSGGIESRWGAVAVEASAALMIMGILSVPSMNRGLSGWEGFAKKWLGGKFID